MSNGRHRAANILPSRRSRFPDKAHTPRPARDQGSSPRAHIRSRSMDGRHQPRNTLSDRRRRRRLIAEVKRSVLFSCASLSTHLTQREPGSLRFSCHILMLRPAARPRNAAIASPLALSQPCSLRTATRGSSAHWGVTSRSLRTAYKIYLGRIRKSSNSI